MNTHTTKNREPSASSGDAFTSNDGNYAPESACQLERLGPLLAQSAFSACKTLQIYDSNNRAVDVVLSRLMMTLRELFALEERATLRISTDLLLLNDSRIIVEPQSAGPVLYLLEEMKKRKVEEIDFFPGVTEDELGRFFRLFSQEPAEEDVYGELEQKLTKSAIQNIRLAEWIERVKYLKDSRVRRQEIREESNRVMSRAILFMNEVMRSIEQKRPIQFPKANRLTQQIADIVQNDETILLGLASLKDYDEYTFSHSVNVSVLSILIAERLGLSKSTISKIGVAALFHDIGKTHVPKSILNKPSALSSDEWTLMERHSMLGVVELSRVRSLRSVIDPIFVSLQHHLLYDLTGYPQKPHSWELHPYTPVITIADVYDAMTTPRIYRKKVLTPDKALRFILAKSGKLFHPLIAQVFIKTMGVYPVGTVVELDTGERAVVVKQNEQIHMLHRPIVDLLKRNGDKRESINLADPADGGTGYRRTIVRSLHDTACEAQKASSFISH